MSVPGNINQLQIGAASASESYQIERSLRLEGDDAAYLYRTQSTGDLKKWTLSFWTKNTLSLNTTYPALFGANVLSSNRTFFRFMSTGHYEFFAGGTTDGSTPGQNRHQTLETWRDASAWHHIHLIWDTANATAADRCILFVNGVRSTWDGTFTANATCGWNAGVINLIGKEGGYSRFYNGYMAEFHHVDGAALDCTDFGEFDNNGVWRPKEFEGDHNQGTGVNGFYLNFSDSSSTANLGTDSSGNGNNWSTTGFSVTPGPDNDSFFDSPTNGTQADTGVGGEVNGNYATLDPLSKGTAVTLNDGNLEHYSTDASWSGPSVALTGFGMTAGKWYWECTINTNTYSYIGIAQLGKLNADIGYIGGNNLSCGYLTSSGAFVGGGAQTADPAVIYTAGRTLMFAYDADAKKFWVGENGTWFSVGGVAGDPANGNNPSHTGFGSDGEVYSPATSTYGAVTTKYNFGQRAFSYTAPSGFKSLCTTNLPTSTIPDGSDFFDVLTWTGDGGGSRSFTGLSFQPDWTWVKIRTQSYTHTLFDSVRGAGSNKDLSSDNDGSEGSANTSLYGYLSSFDSTGFSSTEGSSDNDYFNRLNDTYVAWNWNAGGSTESNTDGTITSSVRANASAGFSIVTYTGNGTAGATVGHGLNDAPGFYVVKRRDAAAGWRVYHSALGATKYLGLDVNGAAGTATSIWNDTEPTSSVFSIGSHGDVNNNTSTFVAYCFAPVEGYSAIGSYEGNGLADGPFVYTGFRPSFVMLKNSDAASTSWTIHDNKRLGYNPQNDLLFPNTTDSENATSYLDLTSNGFKIRIISSFVNAAANTFIWIAFAENPFQANGGLAR
jgi:hypothetical protein